MGETQPRLGDQFEVTMLLIAEKGGRSRSLNCPARMASAAGVARMGFWSIRLSTAWQRLDSAEPP